MKRVRAGKLRYTEAGERCYTLPSLLPVRSGNATAFWRLVRVVPAVRRGGRGVVAQGGDHEVQRGMEAR